MLIIVHIWNFSLYCHIWELLLSIIVHIWEKKQLPRNFHQLWGPLLGAQPFDLEPQEVRPKKALRSPDPRKAGWFFGGWKQPIRGRKTVGILRRTCFDIPGWCFGTFWNHGILWHDFPIILGMKNHRWLTHSIHFSEGSTTIYAVDQRLWDVGWMTGELNDWDHINQQWANGGPSSIVVLSFGMVRKRANSPWNLDHTSFYVGKTPYIISINKPSPSHHHFYRW